MHHHGSSTHTRRRSSRPSAAFPDATGGDGRARARASHARAGTLATLAALAAGLALVVASTAAAGAAPATSSGARLVAPAELHQVAGGFCTNCDDGSGGGGGGDGSSGSPVATGSPYWETYRVTLTSSSTTPAALVSKINNYADQTIHGTFTYTRKVVRDVQFSGGYATFVRASIGGEVSQSSLTSVTYPIEPHTYGKLYVKYRTDHRTYYGRHYQDYNDGSRVVIGRDSGPYQSTSTVLGYVTGGL